MIEKKISYDINIEKPSKTKPVKQGGVLNYLGKQKTVSAPVKWRSSPKHPIAHLAYITKDEEKILVDLDLYGSLKGKPNKGPSGIMSLNGGGGGGDGGGGDGGGGDGGGSSGGDGDGGPGDSGPGGSDDGSGHGGPGPGDSGPGDSGPGGSDDGTGHGGPGPGFAGDDAGSMGGLGNVGSLGVSDVGNVSVSDVAGMSENAGLGGVAGNALGAAATEAAAQAAQAAESQPGIMSTLGNVARSVMNAYATFSPLGIAMNAISNISRGVTAPDDYSQLDTSVQTSSFGSPGGGGGITTIPTYAPLTNVSTGDNTADSIRTRLENLLRAPTSQPVFTNQNVNPLSNYTLLDLYNLRK